jgi:peptidoglycan/xylan/chitin deacetylase (PgdA/CDA1 family)
MNGSFPGSAGERYFIKSVSLAVSNKAFMMRNSSQPKTANTKRQTPNANNPPRLAIKVDVDTLEGFCKGVPALLRVLNDQGVRASFFLALGPDNSGRAIFRVFRQQGFLQKMLRTRAPAIYGLKTMCYGTLLPAPLIGPAAPELPGLIAAAGHEVGLHGYDHVRWHDQLFRLPAAEISREISAAQESFATSLQRRAYSFAAPGWQCSPASREVLAAQNFLYASDTRGSTPYFPRFGQTVSPLLEIPTTLPTLDELLGLDGCRPKDFSDLVLSRLNPEQPQVLTIHAELEGGPFLNDFAQLLHRSRRQGVDFFRLEDWARELLSEPGKIPSAQVSSRRLPGRAGAVSCQGTLEAPTL